LVPRLLTSGDDLRRGSRSVEQVPDDLVDVRLSSGRLTAPVRLPGCRRHGR
jgi:hypothetical protein